MLNFSLKSNISSIFYFISCSFCIFYVLNRHFKLQKLSQKLLKYYLCGPGFGFLSTWGRRSCSELLHWSPARRSAPRRRTRLLQTPHPRPPPPLRSPCSSSLWEQHSCCLAQSLRALGGSRRGARTATAPCPPCAAGGSSTGRCGGGWSWGWPDSRPGSWTQGPVRRGPQRSAGLQRECATAGLYLNRGDG